MNNFESTKRNFVLDPTITNALKLIVVMKRFSISLPEKFSELELFFNSNESLMKCYIEAMDYGDPSEMSCHIFMKNKENIIWTLKIIENDKVGQSAVWAYELAKAGQCCPEWAKKVIENSRVIPAWVVSGMVKFRLASRKWENNVNKKWRLRKADE